MAIKQNYVVFGATSTLGSYLCRKLADDGHALVVSGRDNDKIRTLADSIGAIPTLCDVTKSEDISKVLDEGVKQLGDIHGVVNCAGSILIKPAHLTSEAEWNSLIDTNLRSSFLVVKNSVKTMMRTGGSIVLISSAVAQYGMPNHEAIAAAKAGVEGLVLSAAASYANRGIRVNCVAPGFFESNSNSSIFSNEKLMKPIINMHPLGRVGKPENVGSAIEWLLDVKQDWVTGQVIAVDGGLSKVQPRVKIVI